MIENNDIKKLKSKIQIDRVFNKGKAIRSGALVMHFISERKELKNTFIGVGVSKSHVQLAYRRNRIKRQIRAIIQQQKDALMKTLSGQLTEQLSKQTKALTGNMDSLFTDKIKPEMDTQHQEQLDALPKKQALRFLSQHRDQHSGHWGTIHTDCANP